MKRLLSTALILFSLGALAAPALAANPCSVNAQKHAIDAQKHQLDRQKQLVAMQYPGPANAAYRLGVFRQIEAQKHQLDFQKHQLDMQRRQCELAYHPKKHKEHTFKYKYKDKDDFKHFGKHHGHDH